MFNGIRRGDVIRFVPYGNFGFGDQINGIYGGYGTEIIGIFYGMQGDNVIYLEKILWAKPPGEDESNWRKLYDARKMPFDVRKAWFLMKGSLKKVGEEYVLVRRL